MLANHLFVLPFKTSFEDPELIQNDEQKCVLTSPFCLLLSELPLIFITPLSDVKVFEKDEAKFECEVSREPKTFRWLKGTQEIASDDKFELIKDGTRHSMIIKSAAFEDEAKYMFEAEDKRTSGKLIIEGQCFHQMNHI